MNNNHKARFRAYRSLAGSLECVSCAFHSEVETKLITKWECGRNPQRDGHTPHCHLTLENDLDLEVTLTKIKPLCLLTNA